MFQEAQCASPGIEKRAGGSPGKSTADDLRDEAALVSGLRVRLPVGYVFLQVVGMASVRPA
jgi:hypothetical protein